VRLGDIIFSLSDTGTLRVLRGKRGKAVNGSLILLIEVLTLGGLILDDLQILAIRICFLDLLKIRIKVRRLTGGIHRFLKRQQSILGFLVG
jgi:hypothetical protein